jgi:hypothetical protein
VREGYECRASHEGIQQLFMRIKQFEAEGVQQPVRTFDELGITQIAEDEEEEEELSEELQDHSSTTTP